MLDIRLHLRVDENESLQDLAEISSKNENFLRNCIGEEDEEKERIVFFHPTSQTQILMYVTGLC